MRVIYSDFPIRATNGAVVGRLNGEYEATANQGQQPGWHALRKVDEDGNVGDEIVANVHIVGGATT